MKISRKILFFYIFLYITLLIGFFCNENSSGGAIHDFEFISKVIISFSQNYEETFNNFNKFNISHFPYYYISLSFFYSLFESLALLKFSILHLSLLLPFFFYKIISIKFEDQSSYLIYIPGVLFLSVYFRSNAIWVLNDNLALIFFCLSIFFYYKAINENKQKNILFYSLLNLISLVFAAYTRQYYAVFWLFFIYNFFIRFGQKTTITYIIISSILSIPALNAIFNTTNLNYSLTFYSDNLFNNMILVPSIFFIYLIPIYFDKHNIKKIFYFYKKNFQYLFLNLFLVLFFMNFFDYLQGPGGGIIFKIFYHEDFIFLFYFFILITFLFTFHFLSSNFKENILIYILIIMMFQLNYIFQKYLDPLSIILIFSLFKSDAVNNFIINLKYNIRYLYLYFLLIYSGSFSYYYF